MNPSSLSTCVNDLQAVEVRSAAGEVVALLCSSYRFLQSVEEEEDADEGFEEVGVCLECVQGVRSGKAGVGA